MPSSSSSSSPTRSYGLENLIFLSTTIGVGVYFFQKSRRENKRSNASILPIELKNSTLGREMQVAVDLALRAGSNMVPYSNEKGTAAELAHDLGILEKGQPEDFFTKTDVENERLVTEGLFEQFPTHKVIGEESTGTGEIPQLTNDPTWIIDPIDGTTNFASGLPLTCVSIGFCLDGKPVLGVAYSPMTNELYAAISGCGAFRNGVRITQRTSKPLVESVVGFEFGYAREKSAIDKIVGALRRIVEHGCRTTRSLGSGVLDMCYVATGRLDVVYAGVANEGWKPWDYCAAIVIAKEAGCAVEAIDQRPGDDFDLYSKSIICAGSRSLLQEIRNCIIVK